MEPKILIVDDEIELLSLYAELLSPLGASIVTHNSATRALKNLETEDFDCVLSDLKMPDVDGLDFCAGARGRWPDIPFVFLTGHGDWKAGLQALRLGASDFLEKPVQADRLIQVMSLNLEVGMLRRKIRNSLEELANKKIPEAESAKQILKELQQIAWARNLQSLGG